MPLPGRVPPAAARLRVTASVLLRLGVLAILSWEGDSTGASNETQTQELAAVAHSGRDCSHLKGRLYSDCRCKAALPRVRAVWEAGEVMAAVAAAETCDRSSPGLDSKDRTLLQAVHASATRVRAALEFAGSGEHVRAVSEFSELFREAQMVPETPAGLLRGPLAYAQCRLWVLALRNETLAVFPPHADTVALAQRVGQFCADTLSDIAAGNSASYCSEQDRLAGKDLVDCVPKFEWLQGQEANSSGMGSEGLQHPWPESAGSPVPWLLAARLASLIVTGQAAGAVQEARLFGADFQEAGLGLPYIISRIVAPALTSNSTAHAPRHPRSRRGVLAEVWDAASLFLCKRWRGVRLGVCQPCSLKRLSPLFSLRSGVPVLADCNDESPRSWAQWLRYVFTRRRILHHVFLDPIVADVWGKALALDCLSQQAENATAEEAGRERRRCLVRVRDVVHHRGGVSDVLAVEASYHFETGNIHLFLRAVDLLLESETAGSQQRFSAYPAAHSMTLDHAQRQPPRQTAEKPGLHWHPLDPISCVAARVLSGAAWQYYMQRDAREQGALPHSSRLAALSNAGARVLLKPFEWLLGSAGLYGARNTCVRHATEDSRFVRSGSGACKSCVVSRGGRRFEHVLLWRIRALLETGRLSQAAATAHELAASTGYPHNPHHSLRTSALDACAHSSASSAASSASPRASASPSSSAHAHDPPPSGADMMLVQLVEILAMVETSARALGEAEAIEVVGDRGDADAGLWPRERKWRGVSQVSRNAAMQSQVLAVHVKCINQTLLHALPALDTFAKQSASMGQTHATSPWHVRRSGALLDIAVEVERTRLLLAARLQRLVAYPAMCIHAGLHALALHHDDAGWLDSASSSAAAKIKTSVSSLDKRASAERLARYRGYHVEALKVMRQHALSEPGAHPEGGTAPRRTVGIAVGMEVLSDCLEVRVLSSWSIVLTV